MALMRSALWPPTYHFERLLKEVCLNHVYPIKHMLKDYNLMKNFLISVSLTWDREPEEDSGGRGATPFPGEDAVMMVYDERSPPRRRRASNLSPETLTRCG
jgi:hypothetical protein